MPTADSGEIVCRRGLNAGPKAGILDLTTNDIPECGVRIGAIALPGIIRASVRRNCAGTGG